MFKATEEIYDAFQEADFHCKKEEIDDTSLVVAGVSTKMTSFKILFISKDDDNDVAMRIYRFVRFDEDKKGPVLFAANKLNERFRFAKFIVDFEDNTVSIEIDFPARCENVGDIAIEMLIRVMKMSDESYSEFMKAIWAS